MGLSFEFDIIEECYRTCSRDYDPLELICVAEGNFKYLNSINKRGYV